MKSEKGITLTSLIIYIIVLLIVLSIIGTISAYFMSNINNFQASAKDTAEYDKFNLYFLEEVKRAGNSISNIALNEVQFSSGNGYKFENNNIYLVKTNEIIKIAKNVDSCTFTQKEINQKTVIEVNIKIGTFETSTDYVMQYSNQYSTYQSESDYIYNSTTQ